MAEDRKQSHSRLKPMAEVGKILQGRLANILTYVKHQITNAPSESLNAKIQWVKYTWISKRARTSKPQSIFTVAAWI